MAETKKLLVAFNCDRPDDLSSDFLVSVQTSAKTVLYGLKSGREHVHGLVVYLGRAVNEEALLAKLIQSSSVAENSEASLQILRQYVEALQSLKIGNVVRLRPNSGVAEFEFAIVAQTPAALRR